MSVCFEHCLVNSSAANKFTLSLCNVRSLRKHVCDLFADKSVESSDVILCTETQLTSTDNSDDIEIDGFTLTCPGTSVKKKHWRAIHRTCKRKILTPVVRF